MMRIFFTLCIFLLVTVSVSSQEETRFDYFFIQDGGVFFHKTQQPLEKFEFFKIPEIEPYSNYIQTADMSSDGTLIAVLKGDEKNEMRYDLVQISQDNSITPLFGLTKREELPDGKKIDRFFGQVDIDHSTGSVTFAVIERTSKLGEAQAAEYLSKVYQLPLVGGVCNLVGQFQGTILDVAAGGRKIAILLETPGNEMNTFFLKENETQDWRKIALNFNCRQIDFSNTGSEILILMNPPDSKILSKLMSMKVTQDFTADPRTITESKESDTIYASQFSIDGKYIQFRQNRICPWGKTPVNFIALDNKIMPFARADLAIEPPPFKPDKIKDIELSEKTIECPLATQATIEDVFAKHRLIPNDSGPVRMAEFSGNSIKISGSDPGETASYNVKPESGAPHGLALGDSRLLSISELDLGERLISFESIPYGVIDEIPSGGESISHEIHLAWNIGGKMLGIKIPEKNMIVGADSGKLHVILKYPYKGVFPASKEITPFYFLMKDGWIIEHPAYLGKTETIQYITRSFEDKSGNLYLLDSLNSNIVIYNKERANRIHIGLLPEKLPLLAYPTDMILKDNTLYVLDPLNNRIVSFSLEGIPLEIIHLNTEGQSLDNTRFLRFDEKIISLIDEIAGKLYDFDISK
jgi:hypothetical protein